MYYKNMDSDIFIIVLISEKCSYSKGESSLKGIAARDLNVN